jgi:DGQHR domain-containing protein
MNGNADVKDFSRLSGYESGKKIKASRYKLGGKSVFIVSLPLNLISAHLPIPDPDEPFDGNRRVNLNHAKKFGEYWRQEERCITAPLLFDTMHPLSSEFEVEGSAGGIDFGELLLPHNSNQVLDILDGQHRILGWHLISGQINKEMKEARSNLSRATSANETESIILWQRRVDELRAELQRLDTNFVTLQIVEGLTVEEHEQVFADIVKYAKGITKSVTVRFNQREIVNQIAIEAMDTIPLLEGRTDFEKDRATGSSEYLISAKNVADIVFHTLVGLPGRMTAKREKNWAPIVAGKVVTSFFQTLVASFPELQQVQDDELQPAEFRARSLLGSPTVLRCLAGAFHGIAVVEERDKTPHVTPSGQKKAEELFKKLSGHMSLPISDEWFATGYFPEKTSNAPSSKTQDLNGLTKLIASWADSEPFAS